MLSNQHVFFCRFKHFLRIKNRVNEIGGFKMRKIKKMLTIFFAMLIFFTTSQNMSVNANSNSLTIEDPYHITGLSYEQAPEKWKVMLSGNRWDWYVRYSYQGHKVYCVDPDRVAVKGGSDYSSNTISSYISNEQTRKNLENIAAVGYGYQGDTSDEMDFATQLRLWQELYGTNFVYNISPSIQSKIDAINSRLNVLNQTVSFQNSNIVLKGYGKEYAVTLTDSTSTFDAYVESSNSGIHYQKNGNQLTIWAEEGDNANSKLSFQSLSTEVGSTSIVYTSPTSQNLIYLSGFHPKTATVNVKIQTGSIQLTKEDVDSGKISPSEASLVGAVYDVIDDTTKKSVGHLTIGENLKSNKISNLPIDHTYTIQEIEAPKGYTLNSEKIKVDFSKMDGDIVLYEGTVSDKVIEGKFKIKKVITDGSKSSIVTPEADAQFIAIAKKYVEQYGSLKEAMKHTDSFLENEWDLLTTDKNGEATSKKLAYGTYVVGQTKGQDETELYANTFEFQVESEEQETKEYIINNRPNKYYVRLIKEDKDTNQVVTFHSATFKIKDSKGNYVTQHVGSKTYDTFTTTSSSQDNLPAGTFYVKDEQAGTVTTPLELSSGTYTIEEVISPDGFLELKEPIQFEIKKEKVSEIDEDGHSVIEVHIENLQPKGKLTISKSLEIDENVDVSLIQSTDLSEIEFGLYAGEEIINQIDGSTLYKKGDLVTTLQCDENGNASFENIPMGKYILKETKTISGFALDTKEYEIEYTQEDTSKEIYSISKELTNKPTRVSFSKTDVTGDEELEGAHLRVLDKQGNVLNEWVSTKNKHIIEGLPVGEYILEETIAPEGYAKATSIEFEVTNTNKIQHVTMVDKVVSVSKTDITGENEIIGAQIEVSDENGVVIDQWTSTESEHKISGLEVGKTYTLKETIAPGGFVQSNSISFTVDDDEKNQHVVMKDNIIQLQKVDQSNQSVDGAIFEVKDEEGNLIDQWTSGDTIVKLSSEATTTAQEKGKYETDEYILYYSNSSYTVAKRNGESIKYYDIDAQGKETLHRIDGLVQGKTYTITEVQTPKGYISKESQSFTVGQENQVIKWVNNKLTKVSIDKQNEQGKSIKGAELEIVDKNNKVVDRWTSDGNVHNVSLIIGEEYTLIEKKSPSGYVVAESITFEAQENQKIVMVDQTIKSVQTAQRTRTLVWSVLIIVALLGILKYKKYRHDMI